MTPERQKKIDDLHRRSNRILEIVFGALLLLGISILLKPLLAALGFDMENYAWFTIVKVIYKYTGIILGILSILAICTTGIISFWATDEEKEEFKRTVKDAVQELESEKKTRTKTVYNGKSPLKDYLSDGQIAVIHKFLCDIPDQGDHIKTSELKHKLHVLEDREDIDLSDRDQVLAWVEHITKRSVETSKFWNEYEWRRSKDQEKKWSKYIVTEYDKLR